MEGHIKVKLVRSFGQGNDIEVEFMPTKAIAGDSNGLVEFEAIVNKLEDMIHHYIKHHATNERILNDDRGYITKEYPATEIRVKIDGGKTYYRVATPEFNEFGIAFWPEHMKESGVDPKDIPVTGRKCKEGSKIVCEMIDGKPKKVLKFIRAS